MFCVFLLENDDESGPITLHREPFDYSKKMAKLLNIDRMIYSGMFLEERHVAGEENNELSRHNSRERSKLGLLASIKTG